MQSPGDTVWICAGGSQVCHDCPQGGRPELPVGARIAKGILIIVALTGDQDGGAARIETYSVNDFCSSPRPVPDPDQHGYY